MIGLLVVLTLLSIPVPGSVDQDAIIANTAGTHFTQPHVAISPPSAQIPIYMGVLVYLMDQK